MIDLTQEEIKMLILVLDSVSFKLADAPKIIPLRKKLGDAIVPEKPHISDMAEKPVDAEIVK